MNLLLYNSSVRLLDLTEERAMMIAKILALTIFIVMFVLIITDKIEKCHTVLRNCYCGFCVRSVHAQHECLYGDA